ncbi:MAG: fatty acid desaturase, partial [Verrucomicrobiae bacterium]|nr:fatty acid desaturase [Verrucomicrobiae bacterium]
SRIIHSDPFTQWAVLGYGNDFHLIHHIYPNVPQYALRGCHSQLMTDSEDYRNGIEETRGIIQPRGESASDQPGLLDALADTGPMPHHRHPDA